MCRVFLDTNILVDLVVETRRFHTSSASLIRVLVERGKEVFAGAGSFKDVYYIVQKATGSEAKARKSIRTLKGLVGVVDLTDSILSLALDSDEPDLEDGIVWACAESCAADFIVSHDAAAFLHAGMPKYSAEEALSRLQ